MSDILLWPYLVLMGLLQRLNLVLVLIVLGVEGINNLETETGLGRNRKPFQLFQYQRALQGKGKAQHEI